MHGQRILGLKPVLKVSTVLIGLKEKFKSDKNSHTLSSCVFNFYGVLALQFLLPW
jgi:hypothetical protein